ncbi:dihydropteroate synthase [Dinghuibacter silviterrae]|uniref:dihydropteroate synthase n=1 Tax=Dinghuibacter silviterrae TaxID=1539049 RepID=A0A4V3GM16_9BACT|nr:dihydropteroate synthase [Dinghuibacter silviterrae]TDX01693.1 dihydropteroate synthase [Dinghuibacter silviterrae]
MTSKSNGYTLDCKGQLIPLDRPRLMGILNATEDSFFADSRVGVAGAGSGLSGSASGGGGFPAAGGVSSAVDRAGRMLEEGADFLDVGGQSTRPGARALDAAEETDRVLPVIEAIRKHYPHALVSIDTYHSGVARAAVEAGAVIVNDISAGHLDPLMLETVAALRVPYIAMHMRGTPQTMQEAPHYEDITGDVLTYLAEAVHRAQQAGIHDVVADPGFGFGKTIAHNYTLLRGLDKLAILDRPLLIGLSRKSMIYKTLGTTAEHALNGTTALHMAALLKGAHILRVHDVAPAREVVRLWQALHA